MGILRKAIMGSAAAYLGTKDGKDDKKNSQNQPSNSPPPQQQPYYQPGYPPRNQYGQTPYGQNPYNQPPNGQPPYSQPPYNQNNQGQNSFAAPHSQQGYGRNDQGYLAQQYNQRGMEDPMNNGGSRPMQSSPPPYQQHPAYDNRDEKYPAYPSDQGK
ncbi:hypothetical protein N7454_002338 [Penicillium verhagenii]|nr:hypothetical protein N7454_002338 [Penicillium verhagenii]